MFAHDIKTTVRNSLAQARCTACFCCVIFCGAGRAAETNSEHLRLAFSATMFSQVSENDAKASVKAWGLTVARERHIPVEPEPTFLRGVSAFRTALQNKEIDGAGITAYEYSQLYKDIPFSPIFVTCREGRTTEEYVLLVQQDSKMERVTDLRGHSLIIQDSPQNCLAQPWLDTVLVQQGVRPSTEFFGKITFAPKYSSVVLPVFFHQSDACLTTRAGFEIMSELNPQLSKQLKVLATSPAIVTAVFCFRADYSPSFKDTLFAGMSDLHTTTAGMQVLTVFQSEKLEAQPASCMASALEMMAAHDRVCGGTNFSEITAASTAVISNSPAHTP